MKLDKNSHIPLYDQLIEKFIEMIRLEMKPNEKLISERLIAEKYSISRTTVRQALNELENMGWIYKRHGKGTFVSALNREKQDLTNHYSFTDQMRQMGKVPCTDVLYLKKTTANKYTAEKMGITAGLPVYKLKRLRIADDIPMMLETTYMPVEIFPGLSVEMIKQMPLYSIFEYSYNQKVKAADEEISAGIANDKDCKFLRIDSGSPVLKIKRNSYSQNNVVIEFTISSARSDLFLYKIHHIIS